MKRAVGANFTQFKWVAVKVVEKRALVAKALTKFKQKQNLNKLRRLQKILQPSFSYIIRNKP